MMTKHKHTDECLRYAAMTGKAYCITPCKNSRNQKAPGINPPAPVDERPEPPPNIPTAGKMPARRGKPTIYEDEQLICAGCKDLEVKVQKLIDSKESRDTRPPSPSLIPYPKEWPQYYNSNTPCDMADGPCCCKAWHSLGEWSERWKDISLEHINKLKEKFVDIIGVVESMKEDNLEKLKEIRQIAIGVMKSDKFKPLWVVEQIVRQNGLVEDICEHGVGHPNPEWLKAHGREIDGIHGCDGCCSNE